MGRQEEETNHRNGTELRSGVMAKEVLIELGKEPRLDKCLVPSVPSNEHVTIE